MDLGPMELVLVILGGVLLFGYDRLPDAARSLGRSLRIFRGEMRGMRDDVGTAPSARSDLEAQARAAEVAAAQARARANAARAAELDTPR